MTRESSLLDGHDEDAEHEDWWQRTFAPHLYHLLQTPINDRTNRYRTVYMKKNKAQIRRERHANRLHRQIAGARIEEPVRRGYPADRWRIDIRKYEEILVELFRFRKWQSMIVGRVRNHEVTHREASCFSSVDLLPIAVSMAIRGRRIDQLEAEWNENKNRIRRGDVR